MPPQASASGASGPRLAPAISDTKAVITMPGRVAIVEAAGLAEFEHQFGKDGVVIAEELHQQPDQQAAEWCRPGP